MPYLVETYDKPDAEALRLAVREEHLRYLDSRAGLLLACGAKLSDDEQTAGRGRPVGGRGIYRRRPI